MEHTFKKIKSKYIIESIFNYISLYKKLRLIKINKSLTKTIGLTMNDIIIFFLLKKIIKPIANCEDYLPIIKRYIKNIQTSFGNSNKNEIDYFCECMNKANKFIPQINQIKGNEKILDKLNSFKLGFNSINNLYSFKYEEFLEKYGNKIKEISFMDYKSDKLNKENAYNIMNYIIKYSNIQKIEDIYSNDEDNQSIFLEIMDLCYNKKYQNGLKKEKSFIDIINGLKSYSLHFDEKDNIKKNYYKVIDQVCDRILIYGKNIEELEITKIDNKNYLKFINSLQHLYKLKALKISCRSDNEKLFNDISNVIKENSLYKLEMNLNSFDEGFDIINKNKDSLKELTVKVIGKLQDDKKFINTISNIKNLKKLKIIANFFFYENYIEYLSLENLKYLEIPLYIRKNIFDLNLFFEKMPKLKKLKFYGIKFNYKNDIKEQYLNIIDNLKLNENSIQNLKKINFYNCDSNCSILILKIIKLLSKYSINQNIKEIKIENCQFTININDLLYTISSFKNINKLNLNNTSFIKNENFKYEIFKNFKKLENFNFKGLDYEENKININNLLFDLSNNCKYFNEIGISNNHLFDDLEISNDHISSNLPISPNEVLSPNVKEFHFINSNVLTNNQKFDNEPINIKKLLIIIIQNLKNFQFLSKTSIFDNFFNYNSYKYRYNYIKQININEINDILNDFCLIDLKNIIKYEDNINIIDNFHQDFLKFNFCNKIEKYYNFQKCQNSENSKSLSNYDYLFDNNFDNFEPYN